MNKESLSALVAEILGELGKEPPVKGSDYKPTVPGPRAAAAAVTEYNHGERLRTFPFFVE